MPQIFDTHAHYMDKQFDSDRDALLQSMQKNNVGNIIDCGTDLASSLQSVELSQKYLFIYAAVGIHPECVADVAQEELAKIEKLLALPKVVAIGEIGLDYYWDTPKDLQKFYFESQLKMAVKYNKPVIIHDREAHADTFEMLRKTTPAGVLHCYSGSAELALDFAKLGFYFGFGGALTFKNARKAVQAAAALPLNRLLLETDCPYMAPVPLRGSRCDSSMIAHTAAVLAQIKNVSVDEILQITAENAQRLFNIN